MVLREAAITGLHVAELALDDPEGTLNLGHDHRDDAVDPHVDGMQGAAVRASSRPTCVRNVKPTYSPNRPFSAAAWLS